MSGLGIGQRVHPRAPTSACPRRASPVPTPPTTWTSAAASALVPWHPPCLPHRPQCPQGTCEHLSLGMSLFCPPRSAAPTLGLKVQVLHWPPNTPALACSHCPPSSSRRPHSLLAAPEPPRLTPTRGLSLPSSTSPLCPEFSTPYPSLLGSLLKPHPSERPSLTYPGSHRALALRPCA